MSAPAPVQKRLFAIVVPEGMLADRFRSVTAADAAARGRRVVTVTEDVVIHSDGTMWLAATGQTVRP